MKVTNGEIFNARVPLEKLIAEKLPIMTSYKLAKLASELNKQLEIIDKVRLKLFETYGEQDPDNRMKMNMNPNSEKFPQFASEYGVLMSQEVEINCEAVALPETLEIEPAALMTLEKFVKI